MRKGGPTWMRFQRRLTGHIPVYALLFFLALGLVFGMASCGGGQQAEEPQQEEEETATQPEEEKQEPEEEEEVDLVAQGEQLAQSQGCLSCHTTDGTASAGPTWQGLFDSEEELADGSTVTVDEEYLRESIVDPNAKVVAGFEPIMQAYDQLSDDELNALIAYLKSLSDSDSE